ncbi:MAG: ABC transporter substrate-binding protein, partial [Gemmatimonadota bacterium]|nr:ABC transporter substrate-binding protein [Gemmatimonadota bacterium]
MPSNRLGPIVVTLLFVGCGGGQGGGGGAYENSANTSPFCGPVLQAVQEHQETLRQPRSGQGTRGKSVVVGAVSELVDGMNALVSVDYAAAQHQLFVNLMTLVRLDEGFQPVPYLADRWEISDDRSTLTFYLRRDVKWHDGTPTTAHDVAFTFRRAVDSETGFPNA